MDGAIRIGARAPGAAFRAIAPGARPARPHRAAAGRAGRSAREGRVYNCSHVYMYCTHDTCYMQNYGLILIYI